MTRPDIAVVGGGLLGRSLASRPVSLAPTAASAKRLISPNA
jgi:hypothetical protein